MHQQTMVVVVQDPVKRLDKFVRLSERLTEILRDPQLEGKSDVRHC